MLFFRPAFLFACFLLSILSFLPVPDAYAANPLGLTPKEQAWAAQHPVIRVAPDCDFPPVEFIDQDGVYRGIAADFIGLLEAKLPLKFDIIQLESWGEVLRQIKAKRIDMLGAAAPTPERLAYLRFTRPFAEFPAVVLVRDSVSDFPKLNDLTGKHVAVVANYADHEYMKQVHPNIPLEVMPDISSGLRQVSFGKVDAMILNLASASYYIKKDGISNLKISEDADFVFDLSFAAREDWPELVSILEKGMAAITPQEKAAILNSWISLGKESWRPPPLFWVSLMAGVMVLTTLAVLAWNRILKRQVKTRTRQLEKELEERAQAEREKEQLQQQIYRAKKMEAIGLLAGGVAHDLNNILAGVTGYSELMLLKSPADNPLHHHAIMIRDAGKRAADVVSDLLTISRNAASNKIVTNLNILIEEYLNSPEHRTLSERFPEVTQSSCLAPELFNISGSPIHIKKALMNLLLNAFEATQKGHISISTENCYVDRPFGCYDNVCKGEYTVLRVADSGPGIAAADLEHIFDPFYSKKHLGHSGTGLGLTVVWNTLQDHNGYVNIRQPDTGSIFELYFPVCRDNILSEDKKDSVSSLRGSGEHILVIDDEPHIRYLATQMLSDLNYRVSAVSSGEEALEFLKRQSADLLLLDMIMDPGINGCRTYERVCAFNPAQKALISSGFSHTNEVKQAQSLGAGKYLKKPYTLFELGQAVKEELAS